MDRTQHIIDVAASLFRTEGVGVSTARIAKAAGVSNGTLFNVFPTKQALIDAVYVTIKSEMLRALMVDGTMPFNRDTLRDVCARYLAWGRAHGGRKEAMNILFEAGLASDEASASVEQLFMPIMVWVTTAHTDGLIRGPSVAFIGELILTHLDLVLKQDLTGPDEHLAFEMLCNTLGLSP